MNTEIFARGRMHNKEDEFVVKGGRVGWRGNGWKEMEGRIIVAQ